MTSYMVKMLVCLLVCYMGFELSCVAQNPADYTANANKTIKRYIAHLNKVRTNKTKDILNNSIFRPDAVLDRDNRGKKANLFIARINTRGTMPTKPHDCSGVIDKEIIASPSKNRNPTTIIPSKNPGFDYVVEHEYRSFLEYFPPGVDLNSCEARQSYARREPPHLITRKATIGMYKDPNRPGIILNIVTIDDKLPASPTPTPSPIVVPSPLPSIPEEESPILKPIPLIVPLPQEKPPIVKPIPSYSSLSVPHKKPRTTKPRPSNKIPKPKLPKPEKCNCDSEIAEKESYKNQVTKLQKEIAKSIIINQKQYGQNYELVAKLRDSINTLTYKGNITSEKLKNCNSLLEQSKEYVEDLQDLLSDKEKQLIQLNNENLKQGEAITKLQKNLEAKEQIALVNIGRSEYFQKEYARTRFLHRSHIMLAGNFSLLDASAFNKNIKFQSNNPIAQAFEYSNLRSWGFSVYAKPFPLYERFIGGIFASNLSTVRDKLPDNFTTIDEIRNTEIALKNAPKFKPTVLERTDGRSNRFNAGIYLHTDKVKLLSHLYLMVGGAFRYGNEWDVYKGNLIKSIPAFSEYSPDIKYYAVKKTDGIKPILGLAVVNPFVQMESGYNWYNKNFFMNIGLNIPISYFKLLYNKDDENLEKSNLKNKANDEYINRND